MSDRSNQIKGVIFDKDGTLFDFNATWGAWAETMIAAETRGDSVLKQRLADRLDYDLENKVFRPGSIVIAETVEVTADAILEVLKSDDKSGLIKRMNDAATQVPQIEATPLGAFVAELKELGLKIGVATNDAEGPARSHLSRAGVEQAFDFIAGFDSGYGGKPAPGQLLGFCEQEGLQPDECVMVGDSTHDLDAGRAAGMICVGVLTGPAPEEELAPFADVVLTSIAQLPDWLRTGRV
ncbi:phosphoglycolate phosphatase [Cognatiyoonia sediminum]|uniref:phosphoglycolate phosphatase n=1 Tax=Cognatiyoonia sediminum TaxID=1508389 RepID=A0A1M5NA05_9RHOB|nr:HAD family hydrolase [Cognatiyoonia sediminum]SHG86350.1 phosphoglycolate phosphatase [Cognatiyoonia sediminum]